jgi:hypothetical protein
MPCFSEIRLPRNTTNDCIETAGALIGYLDELSDS